MLLNQPGREENYNKKGVCTIPAGKGQKSGSENWSDHGKRGRNQEKGRGKEGYPTGKRKRHKRGQKKNRRRTKRKESMGRG